MSSYSQTDAGSPQQPGTPVSHSGKQVCTTIIHWEWHYRLHLCPDHKETPRRTLEGQCRDAGEDTSVLLVSFLFPNRRGPAPCPKTSMSVLQGIHVHHFFTASRLVLWLFKQPHPHKRRKYQLQITIPLLWGHPWFIPITLKHTGCKKEKSIPQTPVTNYLHTKDQKKKKLSLSWNKISSSNAFSYNYDDTTSKPDRTWPNSRRATQKCL